MTKWWFRTHAVAMILCGPVLATAADTTPPPGTDSLPLVTVEGHVYVEGGNPLATTRVGIFDSLKPASSQCPRSIKPEACLEYLFSIGAARAHAVTGADGGFKLQVPGGLVSTDIFWAEAENPRGQRLRISGPISSIHSLPTATLGDIRLHVLAQDLIVQVRSDGKPVANAQVEFWGGAQERTDDTGSVSKQLNSGVNLLLSFTVRAAGFATAEWGGGVAPGTTTQVIDLVRESMLTGRITDSGGRPVAQAVLTAIPVANPMGVGMGLGRAVGTTRSDTAGAFALHGLRAGQQYRILIETDNLSVANGERIITAGSDPLDIVMNAAVPVKLTISGLHDRLAAMLYTKKQRAPMPKVPAVISESDRAFASLNKKNIGLALVSQPDLVEAMFASRGAANAVILMEWLDPDTGAWLQVSSPRHVKFKSATRADLQFDQVPLGTIRIRTMGKYVPEDFDPVTIRAGHTNVIPVRMTAYRSFVVRVVDRKGRPVSGAQLDASSDNVPLYSVITTDDSGSGGIGSINPLKDLKVTVTVAGKIVSTTLIKGSAAPPDRFEVHIRLK